MNEDWDGKIERRKDNLMSLGYQVQTINEKLDRYEAFQQSIGADVKAMKDIIVGDGKELGLAGKVINYGEQLSHHIIQDRWMFGILIILEGWILMRLIK